MDEFEKRIKEQEVTNQTEYIEYLKRQEQDASFNKKLSIATFIITVVLPVGYLGGSIVKDKIQDKILQFRLNRREKKKQNTKKNGNVIDVDFQDVEDDK